jgi:hypothetical protein
MMREFLFYYQPFPNSLILIQNTEGVKVHFTYFCVAIERQFIINQLFFQNKKIGKAIIVNDK